MNFWVLGQFTFSSGGKEENVLFNDTLNTFLEGSLLLNFALNTFYFWLYDVRHMEKNYSDSKRKEGRKEMFYLTTHSTHLFTVIWLQTYCKGPLR